ncbi:MAG TPA: hypothetical protein VG309_04820 [Rhizomicrobium sp.]|jgi:hypothetical protein|nr:hypothetical protein [Rhizomicrobium sp.]
MANAVPRGFNHRLTFDFQCGRKSLPGSIDRVPVSTRQKLPHQGKFCRVMPEIFADFESKKGAAQVFPAAPWVVLQSS